MLEFMLSDDGQEIIEQTGYAGLTDRNVTPTVENDLTLKEHVFVNEEDDAKLLVYGDVETGSLLRFELIYHDNKFKGQINTMYNDGDVVKNEYWIYENGSDFETDIVYDPELKTITFVKTVYNPKELDIPPDGYVFKAE